MKCFGLDWLAIVFSLLALQLLRKKIVSASSDDQGIIAKPDYCKRIIRFPRFPKPGDGKTVNGTSPATETN